jgi:hypothetical protein
MPKNYYRDLKLTIPQRDSLNAIKSESDWIAWEKEHKELLGERKHNFMPYKLFFATKAWEKLKHEALIIYKKRYHVAWNQEVEFGFKRSRKNPFELRQRDIYFFYKKKVVLKEYGPRRRYVRKLKYYQSDVYSTENESDRDSTLILCEDFILRKELKLTLVKRTDSPFFVITASYKKKNHEDFTYLSRAASLKNFD